MAATEPVTPTSTLAMCSLPVGVFHCLHYTLGKKAARAVLIPAEQWSDVGPCRSALQRGGDHQIGLRLFTVLLGNLEKALFTDADFQLELHQDAAKTPFGPDLVNELWRADEPQPQLGRVAFDFGGGAVDQARRRAIGASPSALFGAEMCPRHRRINTRGLIITHRGRVNHGVKAT